MSKNNKTPFQLKPKHLIRALFLVSFIAVAALVAGVFSTLNSGKTDVPEKSPAEQTDTRIEVWRPNGAVEPETVQPAKDGDAKTASGNPVVPQDEKGEKAEEGVKTDRPTTHRSKRTENKRVEADKSENTQSDNSSPAAQNTPQTDSQPVENKSAKAKAPESKPTPKAEPEAKPTPKAEPEAKPQAKPRNKDNLDNLF
ncbi:hypothetical protein ACTHSK_07625 [Neisseria sp. P0012.S006]|jgi:hypothetical protein|uniref:hypothetical protein n=1 Tax=Neisseria TaxID=482 RepID=UPI0008A21830|nr:MULTISPECIES: hypothetical protein [Neisseria]OFL25217.1 hypothetical protein HMPREF2778_00900 [Neisseria sp. HMSC075C12]OFQ11897.1 hypothetical protein HMPREF2952_01315 [Neisseria sp. HMSC068C12]